MDGITWAKLDSKIGRRARYTSWSPSENKMLVNLRVLHWGNKLKTHQWKDVDVFIHKYWQKIAEDPFFDGKLTVVDCYSRFLVLIGRFNYLRALPKPERWRPENHMGTYPLIKKYWREVTEGGV